MKPSLNKCPVCGEALHVVRYHCEGCDTAIEGRFEISAFSSITSEQIEFVNSFVRCEGRLNRMVKEGKWGSYPTVRKQLHELIREMGLDLDTEVPGIPRDNFANKLS